MDTGRVKLLSSQTYGEDNFPDLHRLVQVDQTIGKHKSFGFNKRHFGYVRVPCVKLLW